MFYVAIYQYTIHTYTREKRLYLFYGAVWQLYAADAEAAAAAVAALLLLDIILFCLNLLLFLFA